jgi:hypothetical protein
MPLRRTRRGRSLDPREPAASGVGSSATSQQASTSGRSAPKTRSGRIAQPSITAGSRTGPAQSTRWPARLPAVHPSRGGTACLRCLDVVLAVVDSGRRVDSRVRRHRGHGAHGGDEIVDTHGVVSESLRQPPCGRTLTGARRSTEQQDARHVATRPGRITGGGAGDSAQAVSARFQRHARTVSVLG